MLRDLRYALRVLRRDLGFAAAVILVLGLGMGANITVFSVVNTMLLRPLPFPQAHQLVRIMERNPKAGESGRTYSADATEDFQHLNRSFQSVSGYFAFTGPDNFRIFGHGQPIAATGIMVAQGFFATLGVKPAFGRLFNSSEYIRNGPQAALLSNSFWRRQFAGDPSVVGRTLGNSSTIIIGVLPASFDFGSIFSPGTRTDLFVPYIMDNFRTDGNDLALFGRLKPNVSLAAAQAEADQIFPQLYFEHQRPQAGKPYNAQLTLLGDYVTGKMRRSLTVLWCAVGLLLLLVCVNIANLLLVRAVARRREFAVRRALGASAGRILSQRLAESALLALGGALVGWALAAAVLSFLAHQSSLALPLLNGIGLNWTVGAWTLLLTGVITVGFALMPGWRNRERGLQAALKAGGAHGGSASQSRLGAALVTLEVALACMLLVGAGLLLRSYLRVLDVDLGFDAGRAAAISLVFSAPNLSSRTSQWRLAIDRALEIPGIESAGITDNLPMSRNRSWSIARRSEAASALNFRGAYVFIVSPGYIPASGMHLIEGRDLRWDDIANGRHVMIINQSAARALFPGVDPVGRIAVAGPADCEIVGVIADVRESGAEEASGLQMYLPPVRPFGPEGDYLVVRSKLSAGALATSVMAAMRQINPGQPATELQSLAALVDHSTSPRRFFAFLVAILGGLGLLLAAVGIYGVIAYSTTRETQSIGVRMALGATPSRVRREVTWKTLRLVWVGIAIGIVLSMALAQWVTALLFHTSPLDPFTFAGVLLLLNVAAMMAAYLPARRASHIAPSLALRAE